MCVTVNVLFLIGEQYSICHMKIRSNRKVFHHLLGVAIFSFNPMLWQHWVRNCTFWGKLSSSSVLSQPPSPLPPSLYPQHELHLINHLRNWVEHSTPLQVLHFHLDFSRNSPIFVLRSNCSLGNERKHNEMNKSYHIKCYHITYITSAGWELRNAFLQEPYLPLMFRTYNTCLYTWYDCFCSSAVYFTGCTLFKA